MTKVQILFDRNEESKGINEIAYQVREYAAHMKEDAQANMRREEGRIYIYIYIYICKWRMRFFETMLKKIDESRPFSQQTLQHHEQKTTILFFLRIFIDTSTTAHLRK